MIGTIDESKIIVRKGNGLDRKNNMQKKDEHT